MMQVGLQGSLSVNSIISQMGVPSSAMVDVDGIMSISSPSVMFVRNVAGAPSELQKPLDGRCCMKAHNRLCTTVLCGKSQPTAHSSCAATPAAVYCTHPHGNPNTPAAYADLNGTQLAPSLALSMSVSVTDLGITSAPVSVVITSASGAITSSVTFQVSGEPGTPSAPMPYICRIHVSSKPRSFGWRDLSNVLNALH